MGAAVGADRHEHYTTSIGFVVVDEGLGAGGIAVGATHMEDDGEAELMVHCERKGGTSYLVYVSTSPHEITVQSCRSRRRRRRRRRCCCCWWW